MIGRNTQASTNVPFSVRLPKDLRDAAMDRAASIGIELGQYIRDLIAADLSGKRPRRRRHKHHEIRQKLAEIHADIIACANQAMQNRADVRHDRYMSTLRDVVSALLLLTQSIGSR